ncbi:MAG TPA: prolyl oligopeptidase family serine peptidase [Stellaceae bacterium]|jgi:prolyl oligopeptidase|nr:prolyl oligopeptidase family serine peptidase [Stellaceae bacterium]
MANIDDPFLWLEEVEGPAALAWVRQQNERSLVGLEADPRYPALYEASLAVVTAADRIPYPRFVGDGLANFWQDETHVRGVWRTTSFASFATAEPQWQTILDVDALAAAEGRNWVFQGGPLLRPEDRLCMVALSDGGKDAAEWREYDLVAKRFVTGGFFLPEGKQSAAWLDADTLLVARDWGPGTMTASGYPFVLKRWRRGSPLDAAEELFRGNAKDVSVRASPLRDPDGTVRAVLATRAVDFYSSEFYLLDQRGPNRLPVPSKSSFRAFVADQMVFSLEEAWPLPGGASYPAGALVSLDLAACLADPGNVAPILVYAPQAREAVEGVADTHHLLLAAIYRNVQGSVTAFRFKAGRWIATPLPLPEQASVHIAASGERDDRVFIDAAGYLTPNTLFLADAASATATPVKSSPARFDAAGCTVEQFEAASKDGTEIPYFVVRPANLAFDGDAPTLLYGYGGFQVSMLPSYSGTVGKLWLEKGGVYVVANIRGGGEFGPEWHRTALKTERQRAYDDFIAVAKDLIRRNITSPRRLGIMGGSNGGLLMGVMLTQRPDLFRAVVIQVPLLDMLRYHKLLAGASWMAEYGDPDRAEEGEFLRRLSPYHNLRPGVSYPEPFFVTSTKDDRVHPGHARKTAAKMAAMGLPFLYYENIDGGHSAAANLRERARRQALEFTYLAQKLMGPAQNPMD